MAISLESKALNAALNANWEEAVQVNEEILENDSEDLEALCRLGRAFQALGKPNKAADSFRRVLKIDPLNGIAQKSLDQLKNGTPIKSPNKIESEHTGSFIIEPSTTKKVMAHLDSRHIDPRKIIPGQKFILEIKGDQVILKDEKNRQVGMVCEDNCNDFLIARKIYHLHELDATFINVSKGPWVEILAKADKPIFKGEKQEVNPEAKFITEDETNPTE